MSHPFVLEHEDWLRVVPVCHGRAEFAAVVRDAVQRIGPRVVAVELPSTLQDAVLRGVRRLPRLSVVVYEAERSGRLYLPIEPTDPGIEGLRTGLDLGAQLALVDLDVEGYADYRDPVPDPYAIHRLGLESVYAAYRERPPVRDPLDAQREAAMAYQLQRLRQAHGGVVLLVCGMAHAAGVLEQVGCAQAIPFGRPRRSGAQLFHLAADCLPEVLVEPPYLEAVYELLRRGEPEPEPEPAEPAGRQVGPFRILDGLAGSTPEAVEARIRAIARASGRPFDRLRAQLELFELAVERWVRVTGERLLPWQRDVFARYSRNLALGSGRLVCDLYDFLLAVRGLGDENLLYEAFQLAAAYPWQDDARDIPTVRIHAEELQLGSRRIRIRPRVQRPKRRPIPLRRRRVRERYPGEWLEGFDEDGFCSYPPEDLVIENYGQYLRKRGKKVLSEETVRVEPFCASLLDGIDMRETLRNWATEGRIYVRDFGRVPGEVGSVVVIFDEDGAEERYPYRMTWLGEHEQESDMAFYSTEPAAGIVGPGISRCEYGGFLLSYPPRRLLDVWTDPDYEAARSKPEVLLLAALDYSESRLVVHVAARPPRSLLKSLAERLDRKIVHIPIGQLSPQSIKRIRVFHILAGRAKRDIAGAYVW